MKMLLALLLAVAVSGCKHAPGLTKHPHGAPPGQIKKAYRCGSCGITKDVPGSCHGKALILVP